MDDCPSEEDLAAYAAGACSEADAGAISGHASACASCSRWLEEADADAELLAELADAAGDEELISVVPGYRILRRIGEGGMGVVFEAEQDNPRRKVALKVVRQSFGSVRSRQRFEHETEVLGRLSHPGIAQIFAAGSFETATGSQPFFAMELVEGQDLLAHARSRELGVRERVVLFCKVLDAVQYAHQNSVLHRDLKPGNVLVDERGRPRVLDFGVARILGEEEASFTMSGQIVGTVPYMSPEQVSGSGNLDLRADVYALGVMLCELLTGRLPYDLDSLPLPEQVRVICEQEPDPGLKGDLSTIAAKALEKEPGRRYPSVSELSGDLRRYLTNEPITARRTSAVYQLVKFARRNRVLVGGMAAVLLALVGGIIATAAQARRADQQRLKWEQEARQAVAARDFLQEVLIQASPTEPGGGERTIREALQTALERVDADLIGEPVVDAAVRHTLGKALLGIRDYEAAREQLERSLELYREVHGDRHAQIAYVLADAADVYEELGDLEASDRSASEAASMLDLLGPESALILVSVYDSLGIAHYTQGRHRAAEEAFQNALSVARSLPERDRAANVAMMQGHLAMAVDQLGRDDEADRLYRAAVDGLRADLGENHPLLATMLGNYAGLLGARGEPEAAISLVEEELRIREANGEGDSDRVAATRVQLGSLQFENGDREAGIALARQGLESLRERFGDHPRVIDALLTNSRLLAGHGEVQAATGLLREALDMGSRTVGPRHFLTNRARHRLGALLVAEDPEEARGLLEEALEIWRSDDAPHIPDLADSTFALSRALFRLGRQEEGERILLSLLEELGPGSAAHRQTLETLVRFYRAWGRPDDAAPYQALLDR